NDLGAFPGERLRLGRSLSPRPATDQRDLAVEFSHIVLPVDIGRILEHLGVEEGRQEDMPMVPALILSSDSHVFEPPDLWTTRIDAAFRERAPRMVRIDGADEIVIEKDQVLSGIGLISNAGARFEAPETISGHGRFEDVRRGGYDPEQHLADMRLDGVAGEVLYPSQGLFYFRVAASDLQAAIFRAYNDWLAEFCRTDPARLKGIAMISMDDVSSAIRELERTARLGLAGAMITEYPLED